MRPVRIVLTLLLAMSIAVLPAVGGAVSVANAVESAAAAANAAEACCEHQVTPCDSPHHQRGSMDDCASLAVCAAKCFVYSGDASIEVAYLEATAAALTVLPLPAFMSHTDPPPFPPPRD